MDLNLTDFPFTIKLIDVDTERVVHTVVVDGPGAVRIPGLNETGARAVAIEVTYPDGRVQRYDASNDPEATR